MLTRTYIEKVNTIVSNSLVNTGINPIAELVYGANVSRMLVYFDHTRIKKLIEDKVFPDKDKLRHHLKIANAGSFDFTKLHCGETSSISDNIKIRTSSFDLIFFLIPQEWDGGKGFDYSANYFNQGHHGKMCGGNPQNTNKLLSFEGANWYQARNGYKWSEEGIYSNDTLSVEYNNFSSTNGSSVVIGRQRFDIGNEDICLDITEIMNKFIDGELKNYGIGIAYAPDIERTEDKIEHYCGFLTHKTNTFFHPYVETIYDDYISDDRSHFALDKHNRLYLYANIGGSATNLDEMPTCNVNGTEYEVKQFSKGIYYIDITLSREEFRPNTMFFDTWDNIIYQGVKLDPVELDFVTKSNNIFFNIGSQIEENTKLTPQLYGIDSDEHIKRGDLRKVVVKPKVNYSKNAMELVDNMEYRLYVKDGEREIDVIPYEKCHKSFNENFFLVDTSILIPQQYHIDIKFNYNFEMIMHHDVLNFKIIDSLNNLFA